MKLPIIFTIFLFNSVIVIKANTDVYRTISTRLHNVLDFVEEKHNEFGFDGLLGITFAHASLIKTLQHPFWGDIREDIYSLIHKCRKIHNEIYPLLPNYPQYMIAFRNTLLDAKRWSTVLPDNFILGGIAYLGYYKNWTADVIINNKKAVYRNVKSDTCLREIIEQSKPNEQCYVSNICNEMMLDTERVDSGYLLTHRQESIIIAITITCSFYRLLYLEIIKLRGCTLPDKYSSDSSKLINVYCSYIYKEAKTSEKLGFPHHDIFLEQVVLCGMEGYAEFFNTKWINSIMHWQDPHGCYESIGHNLSKRTSFAVDFGCSDHTTGLGAAALALHLRYVSTLS
ncbi:hypothetical protein NQ315_001857 [Exocentrus adspersus]|uniref:Uncharacterized protein n=1 Tax=Exocentrus adspersus TaxID=1586481 RepID=A0AAV8W9V0_9CUCU|nr:hypothetical protein NQ315_001857 [Exocentrus adspersus]